jgi:hypothetical protein
MEIRIMNRGWVVKYKDGTVIPEWEFGRPFSQLPTNVEIEAVAIVLDDRHWVLAGKQHYFAQKRESILFGPSGFLGGRRIESRTIGYWENGKKVKITVDENTGEMHGPYEDER